MLCLDARDMATDRTATITVNIGDEEHDLPSRWEVCDLCNGEGTHVNPSIDAGGISAEQFHDAPGFASEYFAGHYDVQCYQCGGKRVMRVVDEAQCPPELLSAYHEQLEDDAAFRRQVAAERRMGA